jgi:deoxyribonuclease-1
MRSIAIAFLMLTTAASTVLADGQTHYAGSEEAEQAFWSELYISGGDTLYCASPFTGPDTNLVASAVYSVRQIRQSLRCATTNQCAIKTPKYLYMVGDLHNLYPSLSGVEEELQSAQLTEIDETHAKRKSVGDCELKTDFKAFEPADHAKGNAARAILYMHHEYKLPLPGPLEMYQRWHRLDPVDAMERIRNDRIASLQGTRNIFIDDPDAVERLEGQ